MSPGRPAAVDLARVRFYVDEQLAGLGLGLMALRSDIVVARPTHRVKALQVECGSQRHVDLFHGWRRDGAEQFGAAFDVREADCATPRVAAQLVTDAHGEQRGDRWAGRR
ncbi:MAG: hypothetical protein ACRDTD_05335 [Pseudonocardiaceae bacterium]